MRTLLRTFAVFVLVVFATAAAPPQRALGKLPVITIPAILSLTGSLAFQGNGQRQLLELLEQISNSTEPNANTVHFTFVDDQSNPQVALQLVNQAMAEKAPALIGPDLTQNCFAVMPVLTQGPVAYCTSPGPHPPDGSYMFSGGIDARDIQLVAIRYFRSIGLKHFGAIWSVDSTGQDSEKAFKAAIALPENKDLDVVVNDHFNAADLNVAAQMSHLRQAGAQVCFCWASGAAFTTLVRGYNDAGLTIPLFSSTANMTFQQMEALPPRMPGPYFVGFKYFSASAATKGASGPVIAGFQQSLQKAGIKADSSAGNVWDAGRIVIAAVRALGPTANAAQVRDYIVHLTSFPGIDGIYDFSDGSQRGLGPNEAIIAQWDVKAKTWLERRPH